MNVEFFREQMRRLNGLKFAPADYDTHWEALRELPDDIFEAAVSRAQKTREDFPAPVELRQDADQVAHLVLKTIEVEDRSTQLPAPKVFPFPQAGRSIRVEAEWRYYCEDCSDLGWQSVWCGDIKAPSRKPWHEPRTCDRRGAHAPHEWVRPCQCWDTNPALVRKRENQRKFTEKGTK